MLAAGSAVPNVLGGPAARRLLLFVLPVECIAGLTLDAVYGRTHPARADPRLAPTPGNQCQPHHPAGGHPAVIVSASTVARLPVLGAASHGGP